MSDNEQPSESIGDADLPDLLKVAEVAEILRVSKMTVYRLIHEEELAVLRFGQRSYRIPTRAVWAIIGGEHLNVGQSRRDPPASAAGP